MVKQSLKNTLKAICLHLFRVLKHKYYVFIYCCKLGIPWQGITHDLSKFSWIEFSEAIKFYDPTKSPIAVAKEKQGYSMAWIHHKGHNPHHCEYWADSLSTNPKGLQMPNKYVKELIADYLGAGKVYFGQFFTYEKELEYWKKLKTQILIHPTTAETVTTVFELLTLNAPDLVFKAIKLNEGDVYKFAQSFTSFFQQVKSTSWQNLK